MEAALQLMEKTMNETGLSAGQAEELLRQGKGNVIPNKSGNSVGKIIFKNVFTYFNAIFAGLAVLLILTGSWKSLTFLPVIIANMLIGIIQQLRSKRVLDKLALLDVSKYTAIRDGKDITVPSDQLVEGDLIRLESGQQIPADAVVISGEAGVNESLLTGEADEIQKKEGSELMSGSFLTSGKLTAKLTKVGADSYAAKLTAKAKEAKDKKSEMIRDIETIIRTAGIVIIPIGACLLYQAVYVNGTDLATGVRSMVAAVTGMIPEGMYLLVTVALVLSASRLARNKVLLHDMRSIETLARVNVLCVDKTGTITSDKMNVAETFSAEGETDEEADAAQKILASYIRTVPDNNITMQAMRNFFPEAQVMEAKTVTPFSSKTKYSQVETADRIYRLGAPEFLLTPEEMEKNEDRIGQRTGKGQRVLALTQEKDGEVMPILFVALHNEIRGNAKETFADFASKGVEVKVISGDTPLTVSRVAAEAGIPGAEKYVDAGTLDTSEKIKDAVLKYTVFGRVQPEQKKLIVEALKAQGQKVAMTGDGVNDILAMKEADCSIAMGQGSDAARQAAQVVLLDSDFSHMNQIVFEGRRDINNITRSATLFLYKNLFSFLLAIFSIIGTFTYPLQPTQVSLISVFNIGLPAFLLALEPNMRRQDGRFIHKTLTGAIPAALTSFFSIAAMVLFADLFEISSRDVSTASVYLLCAVGFMNLWRISRPFTKIHFAIFGLCAAGFILCDCFLYEIFDMAEISVRAAVLCAVFVIAERAIMRDLILLTRWAEKKWSARRGL